jgi:hypothetical protein
LPRSVEIITHREMIGSFLNSGMQIFSSKSESLQ